MEKLMQYVWNHHLWDGLKPMKTIEGQRVQIIDPGRLNTDAGPDFFNAKIKIDDQIWIGNIEIHVKASDWYRHHHDKDKAYDSIILHVVQVPDVEVTRSNGEVIPQMMLECNPYLYNHYQSLTCNSTERALPCAAFIPDIEPLYITDWLQRLGIERLMSKVDRVRQLLKNNNGDLDQTAYAMLARSMGMRINSDSFQALATSTPLKILRQNRDLPYAVEGMLFGQAKMLEAPASEPYYAHIQSDYQFYRHKYGLQQSQGVCWKMSRMRPPALPHRRIALLSHIVRQADFGAESIAAINTIEDARRRFSIPLTGYWAEHYTFNSPQQAMMPQALSPAVLNVLLINAVIPIKYMMALSRGDQQMGEAAIELLTSLPRENNHIVNMFSDAGINCPDAFTSQACIQLRNEYCLQRKCLYCRIGHRWLSSQAIVHMGVSYVD